MTNSTQFTQVLVLKRQPHALAGVAKLVGALLHKPKGRRFDSQSGHIPGLQVQSSVGACSRGKIHNVSLSHHCFSALSPSNPLSLKSISMSLDDN